MVTGIRPWHQAIPSVDWLVSRYQHIQLSQHHNALFRILFTDDLEFTVKNFPTQTKAYFLEYMTMRNKIRLNGHGLSLEAQELFWRFSMRLVSQCTRVLFSTTDGRIGIGPLDTRAGDAVVVLYYGDPLYLLRS